MGAKGAGEDPDKSGAVYIFSNDVFATQNQDHALVEEFWIESPQVYPNPFSITAQISMVIAEPAWVDVEVFDLLGRRIKQITKSFEMPGKHIYQWNGRDQQHRLAPAGPYFFVISAQGVKKTIPVIFVGKN